MLGLNDSILAHLPLDPPPHTSCVQVQRLQPYCPVVFYGAALGRAEELPQHCTELSPYPFCCCCCCFQGLFLVGRAPLAAGTGLCCSGWAEAAAGFGAAVPPTFSTSCCAEFWEGISERIKVPGGGGRRRSECMQKNIMKILNLVPFNDDFRL